MTKRPSVLSLDDLMGSKAEAIAEPALAPAEPEQPQPEPVKAKAEESPAPAAELPSVEMPSPAEHPTEKGQKAFRTSLYFHRSVHDVLRDIAHAERKNVSDLINEGLDHILTVRKLPTTAQLRKGAKAS